MKEHTPQWPLLHTKCQVFGPWHDLWLPSMIEDRDGGLLQLAIPNAPGTIVPVVAQPGDVLTVQWVTGRGAAEVDCRLRSVRRTSLASWDVQALGLPEVRQRRAYVRADVHLPLHLLVDIGEPAHDGWAINLSEGGVRLVTDDVELTIGGHVLVEIDVDGEPVVADALVVRFGDDRAPGTDLALKFTGLHQRAADRIRRFVFQSQLRTLVGRTP